MGRRTFSRKTFTRKGLEAETTAYLAQLATLPSAGWINNLNIMIKQLKADGNWAELDRLWIFATEIQAHARVSLVNPTATAITEVNSPTWTASRGYTGNGSNMYLNTNVAANALTKYVQNSSSIGYYSRTDSDGALAEMGFRQTTGTACFSIMRSRNGGSFVGGINCTSTTSIAVSNSLGLFAATRTGASAENFYKNGVSIGTDTAASATVPPQNIYVMAYHTDGALTQPTTRQLSMAFIGSGSINQTKLYYAIQNFLQSQNAAIL